MVYETPVAIPPIAWNDSFLLGFGAMDNEHRELVSLIGLIQACPDANLLPNPQRLASHAREHTIVAMAMRPWRRHQRGDLPAAPAQRLERPTRGRRRLRYTQRVQRRFRVE